VLHKRVVRAMAIRSSYSVEVEYGTAKDHPWGGWIKFGDGGEGGMMAARVS